MKRINSSRQTLSAKQRISNYHPSGSIAQHVLDTTIEYTSEKSVLLCRANQPMMVGCAVVENGKQFFLAASKFANRFYLIVNNKGVWQCSSKDEATCRAMIARAQAFTQELQSRKVVAA